MFIQYIFSIIIYLYSQVYLEINLNTFYQYYDTLETRELKF